MLQTLNINSYPGKQKHIIALLMMVLNPQEYVPSSVKQSPPGYNSLKETKNEVAVCKKVATSIAMAILTDYIVGTTHPTQFHQDLKGILSGEELGYLAEGHFASAKELLESM